ncbi:UPF0182 family protein [Candidatus Bathyarchaeota archaeon]|nr:UPF0182 family protein [Candidatus Bathyarchaeota archaeon]
MDMEYSNAQLKKSTLPVRRIVLALVILFTLFVAWSIGSQIIWFWLNMEEFGELFVRPVYFEIVGGVILASIAFVRLDLLNRRSLTWWFLQLVASLFKGYGEMEPVRIDFKSFRLTPGRFVIWQLTKVLIGMLMFRNYTFGMAVWAMAQGWDPGLNLVWVVFSLPFVTPPMDGSFAEVNVIPVIPALTLVVGPLLGAFGARLIILVGVTELARVFTPTPDEAIGAKPLGISWRVASFEGLLSIGLFWSMFNSFFSPTIDFNTRYLIVGLCLGGALSALFAILDLRYSKGFSSLTRRKTYPRIVGLFLIALITGSVIMINSSIADTRKIEWLGPYTAQQITVNRYLAELDMIREVQFNFSLNPVSPGDVIKQVAANRELLDRIRLWDWDGSFAKLKPEIGLIPYLDYEDSDILRFNGTLYWASTMKPILPSTVRPQDRWYAEHFVYTHAPGGLLMLNAHDGRIVDTQDFFRQKRIYYGEGGLFSATWACYPKDRERSDELDNFFYDGRGGIDIDPPLSWIFEFNFFLAYRDKSIHLLRYRDIYDRVRMLLPYFEYYFNDVPVDSFPVTDGENTYYIIPLIVRLDTNKVPWSSNNPLMRHVGYALVDTYNGDLKIIVLGQDYFSQLFKMLYSEWTSEEVPEWLHRQVRYPEELFNWRVSMYNYYHMTDPVTYIVAKEFLEIPSGLETYYIMTQPPGFDRPEFMGLLSLELRGALGRNLAGYVVVRNDYPQLGETIFYYQPMKESKIKLLGPTGAIEALEKNPEFASLKTLLRQPRIGDTILYRVGGDEVYFIPVYTAGAGGVVTELGVVACVGAVFTGEYYVGLGSTAEEAYMKYLAGTSKIGKPEPRPMESLEQRRSRIIDLFEAAGVRLSTPSALNPHISYSEGAVDYTAGDRWNSTREVVERFITEWASKTDKTLMWQEKSTINFGVLINVEGIVELHYVSVNLEE